MFIDNQIPNRQKDEKLILFLRRHPIILVGKWVLYLFLGLIPIGIYFFLVYFQPQLLASKATYAFLFLLTSAYYLYIVLFFFSAFIDFYLDVWIVTSQRIINIEQKGLFNREIAEHSLDKIQDVSGEQKGIAQTIFSYGNVHVQTAGEIQRFIFQQIDNPFEVVRVINNLLQKKEAKFESQLADKINPME
ncbi:MAG: PH domain-containing protein [Candidatus Parcubacteria bacterium]|nr:PH domain-containing protein [Candidatus Parcubacteria bacterium]